MKKLVYLSAALLFAACSDDDVTDITIVPTEEITTAFAKDFPTATNVEWTLKSGYYVAEFNRSASNIAPTSIQSTEVWYTTDGKHQLIETDFENVAELPEPIQTGINAWIADRLTTSNQKFIVDDIDRIERGSDAYVYNVEVEYENGSANDIEYDLIFDADGVLISETLDVDGDDVDVNVPTPTEIQTYINDNYTNARVIGVEVESTNSSKYYDVELIAGQTEGALENVEFDLTFSYDKIAFIKEEADLLFSQAPVALQDALKVIVATVSDENVEIERITMADKTVTYVIDADDAAEVLDDRTFNADGTEVK